MLQLRAMTGQVWVRYRGPSNIPAGRANGEFRNSPFGWLLWATTNCEMPFHKLRSICEICEIRIPARMNSTVLWNVIQCSLVDSYRRFGGTCSFTLRSTLPFWRKETEESSIFCFGCWWENKAAWIFINGEWIVLSYEMWFSVVW